MDKKLRNFIVLVIVVFVICVVGFIWFSKNQAPGKLDAFAQCLKSKGETFYGAFWCPHCQDQKSLFGSSVTYLPYVECSTPDSNGQLPICTEKKIEAYPTWQFSDGSRQEGELTLQQLSEKSGCPLPK